MHRDTYCMIFIGALLSFPFFTCLKVTKMNWKKLVNLFDCSLINIYESKNHFTSIGGWTIRGGLMAKRLLGTGTLIYAGVLTQLRITSLVSSNLASVSFTM